MGFNLWIGLLLLGGFALWAYRYSQVGEQVSRTRWAALLVLRMAAIVFVFWLLTHPTKSETTQHEEQLYLPIVLDDSRSMAQPNGPGGGESRAAVAAKLALPPDGLAARLRARGWEAPILRLSDLGLVADPTDYDAKAHDTRFAPAFEEAARIWHPDDLSGIVLITDGRDHGADFAAELERLGRPVLAVGVGPRSLPRDLAIESLAVPRRVYIGETFSASIRISRQGGIPDAIDATLVVSPKAEDATPAVENVRIEFASGQDVAERTVDLILKSPGAHEIRFELDPQDGEAVQENNVASRTVEVERARLRVLLSAEALDWEVSFIRRHLLADPRMELSTLMPLPAEPPSIDPAAPPLAAPGSSFLLFHENEIFDTTYTRETLSETELLERLARYDVMVLFRPGVMLSDGVAARVRELVERGATLVVLGYDTGNGSAAAQLAPMLPAPYRPAGMIRYEQRIEPATGVEDLPVSEMLESIDWNQLPPMTSAFAVLPRRPAARVLLWGAAPGAPQNPLLLVQRYGLGWVVQSAMIGSWRWQMYAEPRAPGEQGDLATFWLSLLHYTAQNPGGFESRIEVPKDEVQPGEQVEVWLFRDVGRAEARPPDQVMLRVLGPSGTEESLPVRLTRPNLGLYQGTYVPAEVGGYRVVFEESGQTAERGFSAVVAGHEDADYTMDPATLERIAEISGGAFVTPDQAADALSRFEYTPRMTTATMPVFIGKSLWVLLVLLTLLCAEWLLRRLAQLS